MSEGCGGFDPAEAVVGQGKAIEEGRGYAEGIAGGAEVVVEAGEGSVCGGAGAAELGVALVDGDGDAALGEGDGGGEAVGTGADDVSGA